MIRRRKRLWECWISISVDDILLEMIVSETKGYFEGKQTAAEAAGQFENKAKLYYAE